MFEYLFDLPLIITGAAIIGLLCLFAVGGLWFVRRHVHSQMNIETHDSHFSGAMVHSVMIFYGLAAALMAVNVSETYNDVSKIVESEATALAVLYRDVSGYPEPIRFELQKVLHDYTRYVIEEAWPRQSKGQMAFGGVQRMNRFQSILFMFEPVTEGQKLLHAETINAYNQMIKARRSRLDAVDTGLPAVMWAVLVLGAFIALTASFFFKVEDVRLHGIQVLLLAAFIGLNIFVILALDRPFRGDLGLSPNPYQLVYDQLMKVKF
jgi:hypothetical protein